MSGFRNFRSIIELWPTRELCAAETGANAAQVSKWWQRDSIPHRWWFSILSAHRAREAGLTADEMSRLAARSDLAEAAS